MANPHDPFRISRSSIRSTLAEARRSIHNSDNAGLTQGSDGALASMPAHRAPLKASSDMSSKAYLNSNNAVNPGSRDTDSAVGGRHRPAPPVSLSRPSRPFTPGESVHRRLASSFDPSSRPTTPQITAQQLAEVGMSSRPITPAAGPSGIDAYSRPSVRMPGRSSQQDAPPFSRASSAPDVMAIDEDGEMAAPPVTTAMTGSFSRSSTVGKEALARTAIESLKSAIPSSGSSHVMDACAECLHSLGRRPEDVSEPCRRAMVKAATERVASEKDVQAQLMLASVMYTALGSASSKNKAVSKLVYKLSKSDANDSIFAENTQLISNLSNLLTQSKDVDTLLYCVGIVKNISVNASACGEVLISQGVIRALLNICTKEEMQQSSSWVDIKCQCAVAMRNLAGGSAKFKHEILQLGALAPLSRLLHSQESDCALAACRAIGKLIVDIEEIHSDGAGALQDVTKGALHSLELFSDNAPLVTRACFILGSIFGVSEQCRGIAGQDRQAFDTILAVLARYTHRLQDRPSQETVDVLVKATRCVANFSLSRRWREKLASQRDCGDSLLSILAAVKSSEGLLEEELILNATSVIHNLVYQPRSDNYLCDNRKALVQVLSMLLFESNRETVVESALAIANSIQSGQDSDIVMQCRVHESLSLLLEHSDASVVGACASCMINLVAHSAEADWILSDDAHYRLLDAASRCAIPFPGAAKSCIAALTNVSRRAEIVSNRFKCTLLELCSAILQLEDCPPDLAEACCQAQQIAENCVPEILSDGEATVNDEYGGSDAEASENSSMLEPLEDGAEQFITGPEEEEA